MTPEADAALLRAMANPARLRILQRLHSDGEAAVGMLEIQLGIRQPALSQHLGALRDARVVSTRRDAKAIFYRIADSPDGEKTAALLGALQGMQPARPANVPRPPSARAFSAAMFATIGTEA